MTDNYSATNLTSYPTYKDSRATWIGEIPEHWRITAVKREYEIQMGKMLQPHAKTKRDVEVPYLKALNVQWYSVQTENAQTMWATQEEIDQLEVLTGDLLVCEGGEGGRAAIVNNIPKGFIIQNALHRVRPRAMSQNQFLLHMMKVISESGWFEAINNKATIAHFTKEKFEALQIPIPSAEEQTAIVRYLDNADQQIQDYIDAKQKLIALLEEQRQGVIHQAVTRGLDPNVKLKPTSVEWLGDVPEHWDTVKIQDLASQIPKSFTDGDWIESPYITTDGIRLIQTGNIGVGRYLEKGYRYISERTFEELHCTEVTPNDILICRLGEPVARACAAPDLARRMITSVDVCIVKVREDLNTKFAIYSMASRQYLDWVGSLVRGSTRDRISRFMLSKFGMPFPPKNEQNQIVDNLDKVTAAIDATIDLAHRQTRLMEEYRTRLIADVVTGKLDVRKAAEEQPAVEPSQTAN